MQALAKGVAGPSAPHLQQHRPPPCSRCSCAAGRGEGVASSSCPPPHPALARRHLLLAASTAGVLLPPPPPSIAAAASAAGDWTSPGLATPDEEYESLPRFFKAPHGVRVQELAAGSGPAVQPGDAVLLDFVLRRANGYFIFSTVEGVSFQPRDVPVGPIKLQLGDGSVIEGLEAALIGMRQGGKRRVLVPPEAGYVSNVLQPQMPTFGTRRQLASHASEPLLFELELLRVLPA